MPVEETSEYLHVRVLDPEQFAECRVTDFDGKLPRGVRAKYCRYKDRDEWAVQAYLFTKAEGWSREKALDWVEEHKADAEGFRGWSYLASVRPFEADGKRFVKVFAIDPLPNSNRWQVTPEAQEQALSTLIGRPLIGPPERGHSGNIVVGRFTAVQRAETGVVYGIAEVTNREAWEHISKGDWRLVSPKIHGIQSHLEGDVEVVDDFRFEHVAFVDQPAYGEKASVRKLCEGSEEFCAFNLAFAAAHQSHAGNVTGERRRMEKKTAQAYPWEQCIQDMLDQGHSEDSANKICAAIKNRTVNQAMTLGLAKTEKEAVALIAQKLNDDPLYAYTLGRLVESGFFADEQAHDASEGRGSSQPCLSAQLKVGSKKIGEKETPMSADETKRLETLEAELKTLKADKEKNATEFTAIKAENTQLKGSLTKLHEEKHLAHVSEVLDLRSRAGLFEEKDRGAEIERLKTLSGEALTQMASDLTVLVRRVEATSGPKAKFTAAQASSVEEQAREGLFGYRRDEKGVIVHG